MLWVSFLAELKMSLFQKKRIKITRKSRDWQRRSQISQRYLKKQAGASAKIPKYMYRMQPTIRWHPLPTSSNPTTNAYQMRIYEVCLASGSILLYASTSLAIVYFNWWLFSSAFQYPIFTSWTQQITGVLLFYAVATVGSFVPPLSRFHMTSPDWFTALKVMPLAVSFVGMVAAANLCLRYVQVSTYHVARSLTLIFTVILAYLILGIREKPTILFACTFIMLGFIIGSLDPTTLSMFGVITGAISSIAQATYNVVIKKTLPIVDNNTNVMLLYNQLISSFLFLPVLLFSGELPGLHEDLPLSPDAPGFYRTWASLGFSGLLAAMMNIASYMCVKYTSPLTFNIVGFTKAVVQSVGGFIFLGDIATGQSLTGICLSLIGTALYSYFKFTEGSPRNEVTKTGEIGELETIKVAREP